MEAVHSAVYANKALSIKLDKSLILIFRSSINGMLGMPHTKPIHIT